MRSCLGGMAGLGLTVLLSVGCSAPDFVYPDPSLPGRTPEIFAEGLLPVGDVLHTPVTFDPLGREIFWTELPPRLLSVRLREGSWSEPAPPAFAQDRGCLHPFFHPRGRRLYFSSDRPGGKGGTDIWSVERLGEEWGEPLNLGAPINTDGNEGQPSLTDAGTMYFVAPVEGKMFGRGIFRSRLSAGSYRIRVKLPPPVNTDSHIDYTPCIAPDETFLLFSSNRDHPDREFCQVYVSFPLGGGRWTEPVNLCERIAFGEDARFPALSPDGRILFFCGRQHMYWLDAEIIDEIRDEFQE